jgi:hypothetical protein
MLARRLICSLFGCGAVALLVIGCVIEERKYNPDAPRPTEDATPSLTPASADLCETYCNAVTQNCTGKYAVYLPDDKDGDGLPDDCMSVCKRLPAGSGPNDKTNTVSCRLTNALLAASEPTEVACAGAGPGGNMVCGNTCQTYCKLRADICGASELAQDVNLERCMQECPALELGDIYVADPMSKVDTLQCRLNHLVFASRSPEDAVNHCWHTTVIPKRGSLEGGALANPPCADQRGAPGDCDKYCRLVAYSCTGVNQVYESEGQCLSVCKTFPLGTAEQTGDQEGENTVACRRYHAYAALEGADYHCPHAGPAGDGHCGLPVAENNCFSYCRILKHACTTRFYTTFLPGQPQPAALPQNADDEDLGSCMDSCLPVPGSAKDSRYSVQRAQLVDTSDDTDPAGDKGDVVQCRLFHAIRALGGNSGQSPAPSECAAAFGDGVTCP